MNAVHIDRLDLKLQEQACDAGADAVMLSCITEAVLHLPFRQTRVIPHELKAGTIMVQYPIR